MSDHTLSGNRLVASPPRRSSNKQSSLPTTSGSQARSKISSSLNKRDKPTSASQRPSSRTTPSSVSGRKALQVPTMMPRSASPQQAAYDSVHYTRTGRVSKAKKGLKVHDCECGRSYTRAEHLRRHQRNHAQDALRCKFPGCGKPFFRLDLLQRHQERHNEVDGAPSPTAYSPQSMADTDIDITTSSDLAPITITAYPPPAPYYHSAASPLPDVGVGSSHVKSNYSYTTAPQANLTPGPAEVISVQSMPWHEQYPGQHEGYSSSSGYASPAHSAPDYANMFATHPYAPEPVVRTRASSDASYGEPWVLPPRSPTSATSTLPYNWHAPDKSPAPPHLDYIPTSYPMAGSPHPAGVAHPSHYGHFESKTMAQRDSEEQTLLFPEHSYGMGQITHTYPSEQYLDNFWRLFHPTVSVVHRTTAASMNLPPMLHAAMIAIGGQYSGDSSVRAKSQLLHERCIKLLEKRSLDLMAEPERLCDRQAVFLVEVLSQYRARRAAPTLSKHFTAMYQQLADSQRYVAATVQNHVTALHDPANATYSRWSNWIELSAQLRLLQACYILEYQQVVLLARLPGPSKIHVSGHDLPLPAPFAMWEALDPVTWAHEARASASMPSNAMRISPTMSGIVLDRFQSSFLIAVKFTQLGQSTPYPEISIDAVEHLLDTSDATKHDLLTAKLSQSVPIRALLTMSGESWILSEKVTSAQEYASLQATLKTWLGTQPGALLHQKDTPVQAALTVSIELLQHCISVSPHTLRLEFGADMGLYFAALVLWAVTVAMTNSNSHPVAKNSASRLRSCSPLLGATNLLSSIPARASTASPTALSASAASYMSPYSPGPTSAMAPPAAGIQGISSPGEFLSALRTELLHGNPSDRWSWDKARWHQGCLAILLWVKQRLQNGASTARDSVVMSDVSNGPTSMSMGRGGEGHGELFDGIVSNLGRLVSRGWRDWGL